MQEEQQLHALLKVIATRTRRVEKHQTERLTALAAAEREYAACRPCFEAEEDRLAKLIEHLATPAVQSSGPLYAATLEQRNITARDLERERFVFERSVRELDEARTNLASVQAELARLLRREEVMQDRVGELKLQRVVQLDDSDDIEIDDQAASRLHRRSQSRSLRTSSERSTVADVKH